MSTSAQRSDARLCISTDSTGTKLCFAMALLARSAGFERLDVAQDIACSPLQDECLRGQPIKDGDGTSEVPRGGLLEIAAQQRCRANDPSASSRKSVIAKLCQALLSPCHSQRWRIPPRAAHAASTAGSLDGLCLREFQDRSTASRRPKAPPRTTANGSSLTALSTHTSNPQRHQQRTPSPVATLGRMPSDLSVRGCPPTMNGWPASTILTSHCRIKNAT